MKREARYTRVYSGVRFLCLAFPLLLTLTAQAQKAYIGYVYPAGIKQGDKVSCLLGGQRLEDVYSAIVTGTGVTAQVVVYDKKMNNQEVQFLRNQLQELRAVPIASRDNNISNLMTRLNDVLDAHVQQPQSDAIANLVYLEVRAGANATPGVREIRVCTPRGLSNPLPFHVGQLPEFTGEAMPISQKQILGKEAQSLRRRKRQVSNTGKESMMGMEMMQMATSMAGPGAQSDVDDDEKEIKLPCVVNGQIGSGAVDRFSFTARRGEKLVLTVCARTLIPYLADAVPGWFQPVLVLCDDQGKEVAYTDDYRFKPDPVIFYQIPADGKYILAIHDSIFRGREDFVYRITLGELPFVTSVFPLGAQIGLDSIVDIKGANLEQTQLMPQTHDVAPGIITLTARGRGGVLSNPILFALDELPCGFEKEPNNTVRKAQKLELPVIINGKIDTPGDQDLFAITGRAGDEIVAEVMARRLDSPLDSTLRLIAPSGTCIAFNDDNEDVGSGLNTHHADAYLRVRLPTDGRYLINIGDAQHKGGEAYAYRLRISAPQPDFALRLAPSSVVMASNASAPVEVHILRKDGFTQPIHVKIKDPACGFSLQGGPFVGTQTVARVTVKTTLTQTPTPIPIIIQGVGTNAAGIVRINDAVATEDCMQAFLWRHLVPTEALTARVFDPKATYPAPRDHKPLNW